MRRYKNRYLKKIACAINAAYLTTAILCGFAMCEFDSDRKDLKNEYESKQISKQEFFEESTKHSQKEEEVFKLLAIGFGITFGADVALGFATKDKEY